MRATFNRLLVAAVDAGKNCLVDITPFAVVVLVLFDSLVVETEELSTTRTREVPCR